jgi:hypothetical protein
LGCWAGRWWLRRAGAPAAAGANRGSALSGEGRLGKGLRAARWACVDAKEGVGVPTGEGSRRRSDAPRRPVAALGGPAHRGRRCVGRGDGPIMQRGHTGLGPTDRRRTSRDACRTTRNGPLVLRVRVRRLGFRGVPGVQGLGRRVAALGRRGLPRKHALESPDAEAAAAWGAASLWRGAFRTEHLPA